MSKGDGLHRLVQALELNEKRYFKLQASIQKKDSNLVRLFDFYTEIPEYDEEVLRERFKGEVFLDQLAVTQNHLHESILKAMRLYHLKRSIDYQLHGMLQDVQFLYEKGLVEQSEKLLRKVRKIAVKHDTFLVILSVLEWESKLLSEGFYVGREEADIDSVSDDYYEVLGALQNEREYIDLQSKVFNNYYKIGIERGNIDHKTNDQIINQFALRDPEKALTFRSKCCYLNIHAQYHKINGNWQQAYDFRKQLFDLIEGKFGTDYSRDTVKRYFVALNNLIPICIKLRRWSEAESYLTSMESIEERSLKSHFSDELKTRILLHSSIGRLALCTRLGDQEQGLRIIERLESMRPELEHYHRKYVQLHLYFNISYFLFTIGMYSKAIRWLNSVSNDQDIRSVEDLHSSTRILVMVIQFELGRNELLDYLARSTYRFLNKLEGLYSFEEVMVNWMKKVSRKKVEKIDHQLFAELKESLLEVGYEPGDRNALSTIDLISWVDAKLTERPVFEVLKEKNSA